MADIRKGQKFYQRPVGLLLGQMLTVTEIRWREGRPMVCLTDSRGSDSWHTEEEITETCDRLEGIRSKL